MKLGVYLFTRVLHASMGQVYARLKASLDTHDLYIYIYIIFIRPHLYYNLDYNFNVILLKKNIIIRKIEGKIRKI